MDDSPERSRRPHRPAFYSLSIGSSKKPRCMARAAHDARHGRFLGTLIQWRCWSARESGKSRDSYLHHSPIGGVNDDAGSHPGNEASASHPGRIRLSCAHGSAGLRQSNPLRQSSHGLHRIPSRHRGDETHLHRRQGVRAVATVARSDAADAVERSRERARDRVRPHRRHVALSRHRQIAGGRHLPADPHRRGQQRGRLLRSAAEVRRFRRAGNPGQGGCRRDRLHRRRHGSRDRRRGAAGADQQLAAVRSTHGDVRQR